MLDFLRCTKIYEFWFKTIPNCFHHNTSSNRRKQIIIRVKVGNYSTKGDGNDGEPDALTGIGKNAKNWLKLNKTQRSSRSEGGRVLQISKFNIDV